MGSTPIVTPAFGEPHKIVTAMIAAKLTGDHDGVSLLVDGLETKIN